MANISRFEMNLPSDKREKYQSAANVAGMSLSAWMQQAADKQLERSFEERAVNLEKLEYHTIDGKLPGELLIEALEAVWKEMTEDMVTGRPTLSAETRSLLTAALESVGRL